MDTHAWRDRAVWGFAITMVLLVVVASYPAPSGDTDFWWQIAYGEQVLAQKTLTPAHDVWSWTEMNAHWPYVTWLSATLLYVAYDTLGGTGVLVLQMILYGTLVGLFLWTARRVRGRWVPGDLFLLALVFLAIKTVAIHLKPEMFTLFFFGVTSWIWVDARLRERDRFWMLPIVFLLWVNAHGGVLNGLVLLCTIVVGESIARRVGSGLDARSYRRLLGFAGAAIVATSINPYGPETILRPLRSVISGGLAEDSVRIAAYLPQWSFLIPESIYEGYKAVAGWILIALFVVFAVHAVRARRRGAAIEPVLVIGMLGFFAMGMQLSRAVAFFPIFFLMTSVLFLVRPLGGDDTRPLLMKPAPALVGLGLLAILASGLHFTAVRPFAWSRDADPRVVPVEESRFVRDANLPGPLFNDYLSGGYMVWDLAPERKVFIDPRYRPYAKQVLDDYFGFESNPTVPNVEAMSAKYGFHTAIVSHQTGEPITRAFKVSSQWTLVYLGPVAAVFVRSDMVPPEVAEKIDENTDPRRLVSYRDAVVLASSANVMFREDFSLVVDIEHLIREHVPPTQIRRELVLEGLEGILQRGTWISSEGRRYTQGELLGSFHASYRKKDFHTARILAAALVAQYPSDATMWFNRACVESRVGNLEQAAEALTKALDAGYENHELVLTDPDLEALRADDRYGKILRAHGLEPATTIE